MLLFFICLASNFTNCNPLLVKKHCYIFDLVSFFHDNFYFYGGLKRNFSVTKLVKSPLWTILKNDFEKITFDCSEKVWKGLAPIRGKFPFWSAHFPIMWCASAVLLAGHVSSKNDSRNTKSKSSLVLDIYLIVEYSKRKLSRCTHSDNC